MPRSDILEDSYNNAVSGLVATTLQDAIDEINTDTKYVSINSAGTVALATGTDAIAIGQNTTSSKDASIAIGRDSVSDRDQAIAIGDNADAGGFAAISIGHDSATLQNTTIAIGNSAGIGNLCIGGSAKGGGTGCVTIGQACNLNNAVNATAVGASANIHTDADGSTLVGRESKALALGLNSTAIGYQAQTNGLRAIAIGFGAYSLATDAVQIGSGSSTIANTLRYQNVQIANSRIVTPLQLGTETTSTITATVGKIELVNVSSGAVTVNPPASPQALDIFAVSDSRGNAATNNITVNFITATQNLHGSSQNYTLDVNNAYVEFLYVNSAIGWIIK